MRLPEEPNAVAAFERAIKNEPSAVIDAVGSFLLKERELDISTLTGVGLPLRPIAIEGARLRSIARGTLRLAERARAILLERHRAGDDLHEVLGVPRPFYGATDFAASLQAPWALAAMRPDGFLFDDGFRVTELNAVNGALLSTAYAAAMHLVTTEYLPLWADPALRKERLVRSFDGLTDVLRATAGVLRPRIALMMPSQDTFGAIEWGERVHQQLAWAPRLLREVGFDPVVVEETGVVVDREGVARTAADGLQVDLVYLVTTALGLFDDPARLAPGGDLSALRGPRVGQAPLVLPLAGMAFEKGMLAELAKEPPQEDDVLVIPTEYPDRDRLPLYRTHKDELVLKRSFKDKHTFVGLKEPGRRWNWILEKVFDGRERDYLFQEYVSMPTTTLPVLIDGKHIEHVEVRVELSPFIFGGELRGAMVRYAPDAEGIVMSPPPDGMGFGLVYEA